MQGICTKTYGAHRIKATCYAKTIVVDKDSTLSDREQHQKAAMQLAIGLGWIGWWYCVSVPGMKGLIWACDQEKLPENKFYVPRTDPAKETPRDPGEPGEGDITTYDDKHWYQHGKLYFVGGRAGLKEKMDANKFWPNVWTISDHGNPHLITL